MWLYQWIFGCEPIVPILYHKHVLLQVEMFSKILWHRLQLSVSLQILGAIRKFCTSVDTYSKSLLLPWWKASKTINLSGCLAGTLQIMPCRICRWPLSCTDWHSAVTIIRSVLVQKHHIVEPRGVSIFIIMATVYMSTQQVPTWLGKRVNSNIFHPFIKVLTCF